MHVFGKARSYARCAQNIGRDISLFFRGDRKFIAHCTRTGIGLLLLHLIETQPHHVVQHNQHSAQYGGQDDQN